MRPGRSATGSSTRFEPDRAPERRHGRRRLHATAASAGQTESRTIPDIGQKTTRVAVLYQDDAGNWGRLASAAVPAPTVGFLFGRGNPGTSFSATSTNVKRASRYFLFFDATARQLMVHMDGNGGGSGSQRVRAMIYSDLAGQPRNLLTSSFETTIQAGRPAGWVGFYLPYTVDFRPGWYWLGIQSGDTHNVARYSWSSIPDSRRYNLDAFADGPASLFGPPITDDQSIAVYAAGY